MKKFINRFTQNDKFPSGEEILVLIGDKKLNIIKSRGKSSSASIIGKINGKKVFGKAFYTSFINPNSSKCNDNFGMIYESNTYTKIIPKLMVYSPNFIQPKLYIDIDIPNSRDTKMYNTYLDIAEIITRKTPGCKGNIKNIGIIFTPYVESVTLYNLLTSTPNIKEIDFVKILAQIILSITAMSIIKLMHNDLHTENIMIEKVSNSKLVYNIPVTNSGFEIPNVKYKVHIFDWDLAWIDELGNNKRADNLCDKYGICNGYDTLFDLFTILCNILHCVPVPLYDNFAQFFISIFDLQASELMNYIDKIEELGHSCTLPRRSDNPVFSEFKKIFPIETANPSETLINILMHPYIRQVLV